MPTDKIFNFNNGREWGEWLKKNHADATEAWLCIFKKGSEETGISYREALDEALCFGWIDGKMRSIDKNKFILRFSPRKAKSIWSKKNKERVLQLIDSGRMSKAGLASVEEAKKNGHWDTAYTNLRENVVPPDLEAALAKNSTAFSNFYKLANSYRNMYIVWIAAAKTEATRRKRIAEVVKRSALNKKPGIVSSGRWWI